MASKEVQEQEIAVLKCNVLETLWLPSQFPRTRKAANAGPLMLSAHLLIALDQEWLHTEMCTDCINMSSYTHIASYIHFLEIYFNPNHNHHMPSPNRYPSLNPTLA